VAQVIECLLCKHEVELKPQSCQKKKITEQQSLEFLAEEIKSLSYPKTAI
jgi:hypothetical protein